MSKKEWDLTPIGNYILRGDNFHVSYNMCTYDTGTEETALCANKIYRILNGDFRKEYEAIINKGLDACIKVYEKFKKDYRSEWSTDED